MSTEPPECAATNPAAEPIRIFPELVDETVGEPCTLATSFHV
jgi:hypothetical protein